MNSAFLKRTNEAIEGITRLARNLWWTWNPQAQDIFQTLSERKWRSSNHNAVMVLNAISQNELRARLFEREFLERVEIVLQEFNDYMTKDDTWYHAHVKGQDGR